MPIEFECTSCHRHVVAPDKLAGQKARCPTCQAVLDVPEGVIEAEEVTSAYKPAPPPPPTYNYNQQIDLETGESRRPCPMCGELIVTSAVKCRFCGEVFDPTLRKKNAPNTDDDSLNTLEMLVAILCGNIGCIVGIVYMTQGKSKGLKMMLLSIGMQIFWFFLFQVAKNQ